VQAPSTYRLTERSILEPLVSVVIPTIDRPREAFEAARSAMAQSLRAIEVIVVVDGPDRETLSTLERIDDPRSRVKSLVCRRRMGTSARIDSNPR